MERGDIRFGVDRRRQRFAGESCGRAGCCFEVFEEIAELRGLFEIHLLGGGLHFGFDLIEHFAALALEELAGGFHAGEVILARDFPDAGCTAVFDDMVKAVFVFHLAWFERTAGANAKPLAHGLQSAAKGACIGEGTEIACAVLLAHAGEGEAGHRLCEVDSDEQEAFVVAEADVVFRAEFLDEASLEKHGFGIAADDVVFEVPHTIDQGACFQVCREFARGHEVAAHSLAEVLRFANIDDMVQPVAHHIHAGLVRHVAENFLKIRARLLGAHGLTMRHRRARCKRATGRHPDTRAPWKRARLPVGQKHRGGSSGRASRQGSKCRRGSVRVGASRARRRAPQRGGF